MTRTPNEFSDTALDSLLEDARRAPPRPAPSLLARIAADGEAAQAALDASSPAPARLAAPVRGRSWSLAGLWPGTAALAACLVLGIGLGARFEPDLTTLGALYMGDLAQDETVLWSYDLALEEGV